MQLIRNRGHRQRVSAVIGGDALPVPEAVPSSETTKGACEEQTVAHQNTPPAAETTAHAIERAKTQGYEQGRRQGIEAGRQEGFRQGREDGHRAGLAAAQEVLASERQALAQAVRALAQPLPTLKRSLSRLVAEAALALSKKLVGEAIVSSPQALCAVVEDILGEASQARVAEHVLRLHVHASDAPAIEAIAHDYGAEVVLDESLARGDVKATLSRANGDPAQRIEWDACFATRWDEVRKALGLQCAP